jgi:hypothetical protein
MTKHMRGVHVAQVPMRAMLAMAVSIVSVLLSLLPAHTANALPLGVDKLLAPVAAPVAELLPSSSNQPAQSNRSSNSNANSAPAASQGASSQSSPSTPSTTSSDATPTGADIQPLEPVASIDTSDIKQPLLPLAYLASAKRESAPMATMAHTVVGVPPIQATEEGWILFGVAWYWWLLAIGALVYAGRWLVLRRRQDLLASV